MCNFDLRAPLAGVSLLAVLYFIDRIAAGVTCAGCV